MNEFRRCALVPQPEPDALVSEKVINITIKRDIRSEEKTTDKDAVKNAPKSRVQKVHGSGANCKVLARLDGWADSNTKVHQIVKLVADMNFAPIRFDALVQLLVKNQISGSEQKAKGAIRNLATDAGNSYGKLFEINKDGFVVTLQQYQEPIMKLWKKDTPVR